MSNETNTPRSRKAPQLSVPTAQPDDDGPGGTTTRPATGALPTPPVPADVFSGTVLTHRRGRGLSAADSAARQEQRSRDREALKAWGAVARLSYGDVGFMRLVADGLGCTMSSPMPGGKPFASAEWRHVSVYVRQLPHDEARVATVRALWLALADRLLRIEGAPAGVTSGIQAVRGATERAGTWAQLADCIEALASLRSI